MSPQEALTRERDEVVLYQSELWRVGYIAQGGYTIGPLGRYGNSIMPTAEVFLAYRKGEVPASFEPHIANAEEEAMIRQRIQERIRKESENHADAQEAGR